ncbi:hypothetical protein QE441_000859 [Chryseobacterium sp. SORGH_AS909]|nr:hypothetical protein [Chryseobacterium sp. SORGH_AS_0909]
MKRIYFLSYSPIAVCSIRRLTVSVIGNMSTKPGLLFQQPVASFFPSILSGTLYTQFWKKQDSPSESGYLKTFINDLYLNGSRTVLQPSLRSNMDHSGSLLHEKVCLKSMAICFTGLYSRIFVNPLSVNCNRKL